MTWRSSCWWCHTLFSLQLQSIRASYRGKNQTRVTYIFKFFKQPIFLHLCFAKNGKFPKKWRYKTVTAKEITTICTTHQWNESTLNCLEVTRTLNSWCRYASQARSQQLFFFPLPLNFVLHKILFLAQRGSFLPAFYTRISVMFITKLCISLGGFTYDVRFLKFLKKVAILVSTLFICILPKTRINKSSSSLSFIYINSVLHKLLKDVGTTRNLIWTKFIIILTTWKL